MSIPARLSDYLREHDVEYDVTLHKLSRTSAETARTAHIPPSLLVKSVMLEDDGGYVMALVPADQMVMVGEVAQMLGRHTLHLADESEIAEELDDCDCGAVPAVGMAWGIETVVDDALETRDRVFMESGDHERLLSLSHDAFQRLMQSQQHGRFSRSRLH